MSLSATHVVLIDDNMDEMAPLVIKLKSHYKVVVVFRIPEEGLIYIKDNLFERIIVILDIMFGSSKEMGHTLAGDIRRLSHLIPIILWSAVDERTETFSDFINNKVFAFIKKTDPIQLILDKVKAADSTLDSSVDGALQEWIKLQDSQKRNMPYLITAGGRQYTLNQMLEEIRKQTHLGQQFEKDLIMLTIDLLLRNKEKLP